MKIYAQNAPAPTKTASTFADNKSKFINMISGFVNTVSTMNNVLIEHFVNGYSRLHYKFTEAGSKTIAVISVSGKVGVLNIYNASAFLYTLASTYKFRKAKMFASLGVIVNTANASYYHYFGAGGLPTAYNTPSTHSIYFRLTGSTLTLTANVTTTTTTPTSVTLLSGANIEDKWVQLSIEINSLGDTAFFYVHDYSGVLLASTSISLTGFVGDYLSSYFATGSSLSMASGTIYLDYIYTKETL